MITPLTVEDWSVLNARLEWCYEGPVYPAFRHLSTRRPNLFAWLVEAGTASIALAGGSLLTAHPGEWLCGTPVPRRQQFSDDARIISISFTLRWPSGDSLISQPFTLPSRALPALGRAGRALLRFIDREFPGAGTRLHLTPCSAPVYFQLQRLFSAWTSAYIDAALRAGIVPTRMQGLDPRVLSVLRLLDRHPWELPYRNEETARTIGLSAGHLDRLFIQSLGLTPRHYLQRRRLETARARLGESEVPVKTIAYDLGFSSPAHFCHWFRRSTGLSPRQSRSSPVPQKIRRRK